jgi:(p)ppGpp synthase/HD superfamily hydrolase
MRELTRSAHDGQTRNAGRVPYWVHTDAVADICRVALASCGERGVLGDEAADDLVLAAYGHDLYEDTSVSPEAIRAEFGARVDGWIRDLTNEVGDHDRAAYLAHVAVMSDEARVIKCADLIDNTLSVAYGVPDLGLTWVREFFLPIGAETRRALHAAPFERLPATGAHLLGLVDWAWARLAGSVDTATGQSWAEGVRR